MKFRFNLVGWIIILSTLGYVVINFTYLFPEGGDFRTHTDWWNKRSKRYICNDLEFNKQSDLLRRDAGICYYNRDIVIRHTEVAEDVANQIILSTLFAILLGSDIFSLNQKSVKRN